MRGNIRDLPKCMYLGRQHPLFTMKTSIWRGVQRRQRDHVQLLAKSKYQSYWYGNPLALTICVNANGLQFLSHCQAAVRAMPAPSVRQRSTYVD